MGSVPSAFAGVLVLRASGDGKAVQNGVKTALGIALLIAAASLAYQAHLALGARAERAATGTRKGAEAGAAPAVILTPCPRSWWASWAASSSA